MSLDRTEESPAGRDVCARCERPVSVCYCAFVVSVPTRTPVLILQHPREAGRAINTARIAKLCLPNAEIAVGVALAEHPSVRAACSAQDRQPVVLYPGAGARDLATDPPRSPVTLIVIDGTWAHARALVRENPWLASLPQYAFTPSRESEYRIRREPAPNYVSTVEALAEALAWIEGEPERFAALRTPFRAMVEKQLEYAARSQGGRRRLRRREEGGRPRLPAALASGRLVCLMGEANAWPHDRALRRPPYPHELVQLALARTAPVTEQLELFARPRAPLASSPFVHGRLTRAQLEGGLSIEALRARAAQFVQPDDVVCTWGTYSLDLLAREGGPLPQVVIDLRKVVGDYLGHRPGTLEQSTAELGLSHAPLATGRAGERLGMLSAITRHLSGDGSR